MSKDKEFGYSTCSIACWWSIFLVDSNRPNIFRGSFLIFEGSFLHFGGKMAQSPHVIFSLDSNLASYQSN